MAEPKDLYERVNWDFPIPSELHLFAAISGFTDAGGSMQQIAAHILGNLNHQALFVFNNEELLDYRSRRPVMFFEQDHISDYQSPTLALYIVWDEVGKPFLFLNGYEPDFRWETFARAIVEIMHDYQVADFTWLHAIPFPIPHTRPVGVTVSGNQKAITDKYSEWKPRTQVPGNIMHLLEYTLSADDYACVGFVLLVPHYLSDSEYPQAAVTGFELLTSYLGLVFPTDDIRDEGVAFLRRLNQEISEKPDLARMVEGLEKSFQSEKSSNGMGSVKPRENEIPDADEIYDELERYLASHQKNKQENEEEED